MSFTDAIKACFAKYADFNGRAKRPEFWWFHLFAIVGSILLGLVHSVLPSIFSLATLLPSLAVTSRRLHDINKSGWFQLWWTLGFIINCIFAAISLPASHGSLSFLMILVLLVSLACLVMFIYFLSKPSDADDNQYGPPAAN